MTAVTGPPAKMAANEDELTPMMSQYFELCSTYEDSLVLFQVGDFYETFCEAAKETSRLLDITLTQREDSTGTYPMTGIPIDNAASYIEGLLDAGYRVAIADQVQDPDEATGVVDRAVTRIVTPGTVVEDELLDPGTSNYVACVTDGYGLACIDVATGEFVATASESPGVVVDELDRLDPAEVLVGPDLSEEVVADVDALVTEYETDAFDLDAARERVREHVGNPDSLLESDPEVRACGALLAYAEFTQGGADGELGYVDRLRRYDPREYVCLDATAVESLELFENREGGDRRTLFGVLDETTNSLGRRKLTHWLRRPLLDEDAIAARHDAVAELVDRSLLRTDLRDALADVYDIERLVTRATRGRANARDLRSLKATLDVVPAVQDLLADAESDRLQQLHADLDAMEDVRDLVGDAIREDPPMEVTEGEVVKQGFDEELDDLRETEREGREWVAELEERERKRTGIDSLSVGHNQVHGYYIEVTNPNLDRVPDDYTRRQTLKNSERFYTPELKRREDEIFGAAERADALEYDLFVSVRDDVAAEAERVQAVAETLAELDVLASLATVAVERDYVRPEVGADVLDVTAGRHPVVETTEDAFVPNDASLTPAGSDEDGRRFAVITGPNMSGKSTYMRQVALVVILAQIGSFVPADAARVPIVDRVFTRVGASDDIAGGQSTFMREMTELTDILHSATADSLVLLDEVGRGTSTADGLAIAWAVTEFVHDEVDATTLFATHYHGLTEIAEELPGVFNLHFEARRHEGDVTFRHEVSEGASSSSYGVEVARMAGVPEPVVERAYELLTADEHGDGGRSAPAALGGLPGGGGPATDDAAGEGSSPVAGGGSTSAGGAVDEGTDQATLPGTADDARADGDREAVQADLAADLRDLDLADTTPLEALNRLSEFKQRLED